MPSFWRCSPAQPVQAVEYLKQSTAATVKVGPFVDDTDGKTAETALTLSASDFRLSKNGGNMAAKNESSAGSHDEIGYYDVALDTTDTGTLGRLVITVAESGALPVWKEYFVVTANVYDSLASTDKLQVDATQNNGTDIPSTGGRQEILITEGVNKGQLTLAGGTVNAGGATGPSGLIAREILDGTKSKSS